MTPSIDPAVARAIRELCIAMGVPNNGKWHSLQFAVSRFENGVRVADMSLVESEPDSGNGLWLPPA